MKLKALILSVLFLVLSACVSTARVAGPYPQTGATVVSYSFVSDYGYWQYNLTEPLYFSPEFPLWGFYPWYYPYYGYCQSIWYGYPYGYGYGWWYGHRDYHSPTWTPPPHPRPRPNPSHLGNGGISPRHVPRTEPAPLPRLTVETPRYPKPEPAPVQHERINPRPVHREQRQEPKYVPSVPPPPPRYYDDKAQHKK